MKYSTINNLEAFATFVKGQIAKKDRDANCVIYTRVSSKEQTKGMSLEVQRKTCEAYAIRNKLTVLGYFGGTYESAKTDERKEFNRMILFLQTAEVKISTIIVYSVDRFSRSGANAIYIADQLKQKGIIVSAVTQPTDAGTPSGGFQQNIQFIFSEYENQLRREKCMAGVKEKLSVGIWCSRAPAGYDIIRSEGKPKQITLNEKGHLIAHAFKWKVEGLSHEDIRRRLELEGLPLTSQRISDLLRNPFYCGILAHKSLEGKVVEGIQEKAISQELFLMANLLLSKQHKHKSRLHKNEQTPLTRLVRCLKCGHFLSAYIAKKNKEYYYKCSTSGCCCNRRAEYLHLIFKAFLDDCPQNTLGKEKLSSIWDKGDWMTKMRIQTLIFPNRVYYDRQNDRLVSNK